MKRTLSISFDERKRDRVSIVDQRFLPHELVVCDLLNLENVFFAIREMQVRGAPLIGVTAAFGMYLAAINYDGPDIHAFLYDKGNYLKTARPTAVNLSWAIENCLCAFSSSDDPSFVRNSLMEMAISILKKDVQQCADIGKHGLEIIKQISAENEGKIIQILTHCNAGRMACVDHGTASGPIYAAHKAGIPIHVWVDETRPRNQGAITAWELEQEGVPHTVITDNAGGTLMQNGKVHLVIVGCDRASFNGDAANKIGTYLKALAAKDNNIPFYVALPGTSFDPHILNGVRDIPIEERKPDEILKIQGTNNGSIQQINLFGKGTQAYNPGFDVTPARLINGFITERGVCQASEFGIGQLFPEFQPIT